MEQPQHVIEGETRRTSSEWLVESGAKGVLLDIALKNGMLITGSVETITINGAMKTIQIKQTNGELISVLLLRDEIKSAQPTRKPIDPSVIKNRYTV
ncbi:hypothetical protein A2841_03385 [Candidatus Kaiserbacteria bacterium RIFCSPHIGHO2_01_FULL_48_10]|uniref:Uncharacterized protein n=1 Tax=Candidatus Kaiserbacteria bacterium RIFCSPHIGHO2_01_FULL_48_10 TaxID=1798476 RepID=A0A1F6CCT6_9BACT|nr:MAG: hypothetical protein A2841_03385 [Candidatus Kaiserbacteria bacterium RIFCSPHIGHO2_01_FULL_48_10]